MSPRNVGREGDVAQPMPDCAGTGDYNYDAFRRALFWEDLRFHGGPAPGASAPLFDLPTVDGRRCRLADYQGRPVLLELASITCPMVLGARPGLLRLHQEFGHVVEFVSVYIREAHAGERYPHHTSAAQKMRHAGDWAREDGIPWTVAVDALDGHTHLAYGRVPNPAYLIDRTGHVAFRAVWIGQERALRERIADLLRRETAGETPTLGEQDRVLIPLLHGAAAVDPAVARGGEKAVQDFRREMGEVAYHLSLLAGTVQGVLDPDHHPASVKER